VDAGAGRNIEETEAWRIVVFWGIFLTLSYWLETAFHHTHHYLEHRKAHGLLDAMEKIKEELMVTGFVSLILLVFEPMIVQVCWSTGPMIWLQEPEDIVRGTSCCTLGDTYWEGLPTSGYAKTRSNSPLRYICPSTEYVTDVDRFGQPTLPHVVHAFDCPMNGPMIGTETSEDVSSSSFMDPAALHGVHSLIFLTVVCHICFCIMIMMLSQWRINRWVEWEFYGDDPGETVEKLKVPIPYNNPVMETAHNTFLQFSKPVDAFMYIALRRYFIVRNNIPIDYDFNEQIVESNQNDFQDLFGITCELLAAHHHS
jgi:mlo protein